MTGTSARRFLVVGGGAIGTLIASGLGQVDGAEVWVYDTDSRIVDALNKYGARVSGHRAFVSAVHATSDADVLPECAAAFVAVKGYVTAEAARAIARPAGAAPVLSLQNGLGNEEVLAERLPTVVRGVTLLSAHVIQPGHTGWDAAGRIWAGPLSPARYAGAAAAFVADLLRAAGFETETRGDMRPAQWSKLIFNLTNAVGALTLLPHGAITSLPPIRELIIQLAEEGREVARCQGIELESDPLEMIDSAAHEAPEHRASTLDDVIARRRTEVDFLNGAVVELGERHGVPTPANRIVWALVQGIEYSWRPELRVKSSGGEEHG